MEALPRCMQMLGPDGVFHRKELDSFITKSKELSATSSPCTVVSIIGPQSSGKSSLLNCLFRTTFHEMDATRGRSQTTRGIWMAACTKPCMIMMDVEGSDGRERGQNDTSFEHRSALLALTVSNVMLLNMWAHDIGREQGGSIPLLKLIFQERVKLKLSKTRVLVTIRDYDNQTPANILKNDMMETIEKIWYSVHSTKGLQLEDYIEVSVELFPHYKHEPEAFSKKCVELRKCFVGGSLAQMNKFSASGFSFGAEQIWNSIKQNQLLNSPPYNVIMSAYMSQKVMDEQIASFDSDKNFMALKQDLNIPVKQFSTRFQSFLDNSLHKYDEETKTFEWSEKIKRREQLKMKIIELLAPAVTEILDNFCQENSDVEKRITHDLKEMDKPKKEFTTLVNNLLENFNEETKGLHSAYQFIVDDHRRVYQQYLTEFARVKAQNIQMKRTAAGVATGVNALAVGAYMSFRIFRLSLGDPTALII